MKGGNMNTDEGRTKGVEECTLQEAIRVSANCTHTFCTECGWCSAQAKERMGVIKREGASAQGKQVGLVRRDGVWRMEEKMRAPG